MKLGRFITAVVAFLFCLTMGDQSTMAAKQVLAVSDEYTLGDGETQEAAIIRALAKARRQAEMRAAVYVESYSHEDMYGLQDEIDLITGQIVGEPEDVQEKWDVTDVGDRHVRVTAKFTVDTDKIAAALQKRSRQSLALYEKWREGRWHTEQQTESLKRSTKLVDAAERKKIKEKLIANEHRFMAEEALYEGNALFVKGEYQSALDCYIKAGQVDHTYTMANYNSAVCYARLEKYDQALAEYSQATRQDPIAYKLPYYAAYIARGNLNYDLGNDEAALADYNFVITAYKSARNRNDNVLFVFDCINAYDGRACVYRKRKEYALAIADYDAAAKAGLSSPALMIGRGAVYIDMKEYDRAIEQFNKVLNNKGKYDKAAADRACAYFYRANAYYHKGKASFDEGCFMQAAADYTASLALEPRDAAVLANRAMAYIELHRPKDALADAEKAVSLKPNDSVKKEILALAQRVAEYEIIPKFKKL